MWAVFLKSFSWLMCLTLSLRVCLLTNRYYSLLRGSPWNFWASWCWRFQRRALPMHVVGVLHVVNMNLNPIVKREWWCYSEVWWCSFIVSFFKGGSCYSDTNPSTFCFTILNSSVGQDSCQVFYLPSTMWVLLTPVITEQAFRLPSIINYKHQHTTVHLEHWGAPPTRC